VAQSGTAQAWNSLRDFLIFAVSSNKELVSARISRFKYQKWLKVRAAAFYFSIAVILSS